MKYKGYKDLKVLISQGESEILEFKKSTGEGKEIIKSVSGFANTGGGIIIIGVSKPGKLLGVKIGKDTIEHLTNRVLQNTDPKVHPRITIEKIRKKNVIIIEVRESLDHLVLAFGRPYKRVGKSTVRMSKDEYEKLILEKHKNKLQFDAKICEGAKVKDIDEKKVRWFLKKIKAQRNSDIDIAIPMKEAMRKLKLMHNGRLTNAAILVFGEDPQGFFIQAKIRCARFKGTTPQDFIDMKIIDGNIIDQIDNAEKFVLSHIKKAAKIVKFERHEIWEYPPEALREAIVNAVCHRDYEASGNVQIRIYDDRMEIWNSGKLPAPLTPSMLKEEHQSIPRNPLIANTLFMIRYIEQWGTGTNKIIQWCKEQGLKEPDFEESGGSFIVRFPAPRNILELVPDKRRLDLKGLGLNERQIEALRVMVNEKKAMTNAIYREMFRISDRSALRDLKDLVQKGLIKRKGKRRAAEYEAI